MTPTRRVRRQGAVWIKVHDSQRKYTQERTAYLEVVPRLEGFRLPTLVDADDARLALVLSHVPGVPAAGDHRDAHRFLDALHALPCPSLDPMPLSEAIPRRMESWCQRARGHLPEALLARARAEVGDGRAFDGEARAWCHRDWGCHNWLDDSGVLGVIDFEHTAPDHWLVDWVRVREPRLASGDADRLRRLRWLHAIATLTWAAEHADPTWIREGRDLLHRLTTG